MDRKWMVLALAAAGIGLIVWRRRHQDEEGGPGADIADTPATGDDAQDMGTFGAHRYQPHSSSAIDLFNQAAMQAGLPSDWASSDALHSILAKESGGWVGIPNLQFGGVSSPARQDEWPKIWAAIKAGTWRDLLDQTKVGAAGPSSATGLGQLTATNIPKYYPSGLDGIGRPIEEATGMLKYIEDRYGDPDTAWTFWQAHHWY
jgi:hypothetical protein